MSIIKSIIETSTGYIARDPNGVEVGRGSKRDKRYSEIQLYANDNKIYGNYTIEQPEVKVLIAVTDPIITEPPNEPPEWTGIPAPSWTTGIGGSFNLGAFCFDPNADTLTYALVSGVLPTGVTLASTGVLTATSAVVEGSSLNIVVSANDGTNTAVNSSPFTITIVAGGGQTGTTRWNPGNYMKTSGDFAKTDQSGYLTTAVNLITSNVDDLDGTGAALIGSQHAFAWGLLNPTGSQMDFSSVYTILNALGTRKLIALIGFKSFGGTPIGLQAPADLVGEIWVTPDGRWAQVWKEANMDRFIACVHAFIAEFDSNPQVEMLQFQEPTPSFAGGTQPTGYSSALYSIQLQRLFTAASSSDPNGARKMNICPMINNLAQETLDLLEKCYELRIGVGSPDAREVTAWYLYNGEVAPNGMIPPRDYRGTMARQATVSDSAFSKTTRTPAQVIDFMQLSQVTHQTWIQFASKVNNQGIIYDWADSQVALTADPTTETACPTRAVGGCDTNPVPPSTGLITGISFLGSSLKNTAPGNSVTAEESDNWPITWASDGHQYTSFGDGKGFHNLAGNEETRASFGFARIEGTKTAYSAFDIFKSGESMPSSEEGKCYGMLGANGKIYAAVDYYLVGGSGSGADRYKGVSLISNTLAGANAGSAWTEEIRWDSSDWGAGNLDGFYSMAFVQYGQDHGGVRSALTSATYVYAIVMEHQNSTYNVQIPGGISLMRCLESNLETGNKSHWEYLSAISGSNVPSWSTTITDRINIFQDATGNDSSSLIYNEKLGRYILTVFHVQRELPGSLIGFYGAPEPWGPWNLIYKGDPVGKGIMEASAPNVIFWGFSNKWLSTDGLDFVLCGTLPGKDEWGTIEGSFTLNPLSDPVFPEEHFPQVSVNPGAASLSLPSGKAMLVIGMSNTNQYTDQLIPLAGASKTEIVNGAQGGAASAQWAISGNAAWTNAAATLSTAGYAASDVSVVMVCVVDRVQGRNYSTYVSDLEVQYNSIIANIRVKYPNAIITMNGLHNEFWATSHPEPHAWGSNSVCQIIIDENPDVYWGPYIWTPEPNGRSGDGFNITEADHEANGNVHLTQAGSLKVAQTIMTWFATDSIGQSIYT